ncbi:HNH endonuclease [Burkholderia contaminans]|uniref:HNH endonuclease n=1 Tax=Burkholderia contaminans TaxID=488447 RepID=UPI00158B9B2F|nr:HNH endonuclease [Burkholderia contaminans]
MKFIEKIIDKILGDDKPHNSRGTILDIELVPLTMHKKNVRAVLTKDQWGKTCTITHKHNGYKCLECGKSDTKLECHEKWEYRFKEGRTPAQVMTNLLSLCHGCHMGKHIQFAKSQGEYEEVKKHLKKVYNLNEIQFQWKVYKALKKVRMLSNYDYTLDLTWMNNARFSLINTMRAKSFTKNEISNCRYIDGE